MLRPVKGLEYLVGLPRLFVDYVLLTAAFFTVAVLYAAAGFGWVGAATWPYSPWPAFLQVASGPFALICNLAVTGGASITFIRARVTPLRRALPLVVTSVPAAFLGGRVQLPREQYLLLLGVLLVLAAVLMTVRKQAARPVDQATRSTSDVAVCGHP